MAVKLYHVDAFASQPFTGNPAVVCLLKTPADPLWMQQIAAEMNVSETAFLHPERNRFRLRWFTPTIEMALCGHATLASAHVLWTEGLLPMSSPVRFETASGLLTVKSRGDWYDMDFPTRPVEEADAPEGLLATLGVQSTFVGRYSRDYLVEVSSPDAVRYLSPDLSALEKVDARSVIVTAVSDDPAYHFISRFFAPHSGIPEDPVTGSAHCALGPYWQKKLGRSLLVGYQASRRGGFVAVRPGPTRTIISGQAITTGIRELADSAPPL